MTIQVKAPFQICIVMCQIVGRRQMSFVNR